MLEKEVPLLIKKGLLSYSSVKGSYFIESPAVELLENISRRLVNKLKAEKIRCPLFLQEQLLLLESEFKNFTKECFKIEGKNKYLKPTSELILLDKVKRDIFLGKKTIRYYMDSSVFRKETKQNEPGIRHDEIMYFMEGHYFSEKEENIKKEFKRVERIYDSLFKVLNIPFIKNYRPAEDTFPGSKLTLAYDYITSKGKILQIATIHNLSSSFTKLKNIVKNNLLVNSCCYGLSERILYPLVDSVPELTNPVFPIPNIDTVRELSQVPSLFNFIRVKKGNFIVNRNTRERIVSGIENDKVFKNKLQKEYIERTSIEYQSRKKKYLSEVEVKGYKKLGSYNKKEYWGDSY